jgi:hypothetical protein
MVMAARGTSISADDHVKELNVIASETNALFDPAVTSHNETADPTVAVQGKLDEHADRDDELEDTPWIPLEVSWLCAEPWAAATFRRPRLQYPALGLVNLASPPRPTVVCGTPSIV